MAWTVPTKKEVERWQLHGFLLVLAEPSLGAVEPSEEPDFLIQRPFGRLGVELTDLFHEHSGAGLPEQAQEALRFRTVKAAQTMYAATGLPSLHVSVHFDPQYVPSKQDVRRLARAIASLVAARIPAQGAVYSEDYDWENRDYFPEEISHVSAWHMPGQEAPLFQSPSSSFIATLEPSDVLRALTLKEPKVAKYREKADEVWLVINYDTGQLSTHFEDEEATFGATYPSSFDRVFLFRHFGAKLRELSLQRVFSHHATGADASVEER